MNTVIINGKTYTGHGSIVVTGNQVIIDGKPVDGELKGIVELKVEGDLAALHSDCSVTVNGQVG